MRAWEHGGATYNLWAPSRKAQSMHSDRNDDGFPGSAPDPKGARQPSRRQLLRAGLGASPVVLSFIAEPVRATSGFSCRTASSFASVNANGGVVSSANAKTDCVQGRNDKDWANCYPGDWPSNCLKTTGYGRNATVQSTTFKTVFGSTLTVQVGKSSVSDPRLDQVLACSDTTQKHNLAKLLVAAHLNDQYYAANTSVYKVATTDLTSMWKGVFKPASGGGNVWTDAQCIAFLRQTFPTATSTGA